MTLNSFYLIHMSKIIGIDVSSEILNVHIKDKQEKDLEIPNNSESINKFIENQNLNPKTDIVGCESTGRHHLKLQKVFVEAGFEFRVINPILTSKKVRASIRKKKTDVTDAKYIADLLGNNEGQIITNKDLNKTKRSILRTRKSVMNHRTAIKLLIKDLEKEPNDPYLSITLANLKELERTMHECTQNLMEIVKDQGVDSPEETLIRSIPGFATHLSAVVASEVADFERFPSATQFKAYVGIDPKVTQSGDSLSTGKITKRGNPNLRYAFYMAAQVARIHDPEIKAFYEKKIQEGKPFKVAIIAVARKLCERVFSVVKRGVAYEVRMVN